ncbi:MAG TPA: GNAT family N-acetyltransferase [Kofleriaceae bacterium]
MTPALEHLLSCLDAFDRVSWIEGTCALPTVNLAGPKEEATFGDGERTRIDPDVRNTLRLKTPRATGIDLAGICAQIADAFALDREVIAALADVLIYPTGGFFDRHKDTPRDLDQLGSLIVEVPSAYQGGALVFHDGDRTVSIDWSRPAPNARWIAFYGDVDHEVERVISGQRNCITYRLTLGSARSDPTRHANLDAIADAFVSVLHDPASLALDLPILIPCSRLIVDTKEDRPLDREVLRGEDRAIAELLATFGIVVSVPELVFVPGDATTSFPTSELGESRRVLRRMPAYDDKRDLLTFGPAAEVYGEDLEGGESVHSLDGYIDGAEVAVAWLIRRAARASYVTYATYSERGWFGNEHWDTHVYRAAALEFRLPGYRFTERTVIREDLPALSALQRELTAEQLAARFFGPSRRGGESSIILEKDDAVVGGAAWIRHHPTFIGSPMIAPTIAVAAVLLDRLRQASIACNSIRIDCADDEAAKLAALRSAGYQRITELVTFARAPERLESPILWRRESIDTVDAETLRKLYNATFVNIANAPAIYLDEAQIMRDTAWRPGSGVWFDRDRPVAFVVTMLAGRTVELSAVGVLVDYRHHGLARGLVHRVLTEAVGLADAVTSVAATGNHAALELHRACGFTEHARSAVYELTT